jgi:hypothetical protein
LKIGKTKGKAAADKTMRGLRAWWNTAKREDLGLGESPTINVAWYKSQPRKSALRNARPRTVRPRAGGAAEADFFTRP